MQKMHSLLARQLRKHFGENFVPPAEWQMFVDSVNKAYEEADSDRAMLERAFDLSSEEMIRLNASLSDSVARYRMLLKHAPIGIMHFDSHGVIIDCNDLMLQILGSSREKLIGFDMPKLVVNERVSAAIRECFAIGKGTYEGDYVSVTGGKNAVVRMLFSRLTNIEGEVVGGIGIIEDITERAMHHDALKASEEKYRLLVENANEGILVAQEYRIKYANPIALSLTGQSTESIKDLPFEKLIHKDDIELVRESHAKRMRGESVPERYRFRIVDRNGVVKWVEINAVVFEWNGKPATLNFISDIGERKGMEDALRDREVRYRMIFNNSNDAIFLSTISEDGTLGRFIEANDIACALLGYNREEFSRMTPADINSGGLTQETKENIGQMVKDGHVLFETKIVSKTGRSIDVEIGAKIFDYLGTRLVMSVARDIGLRKRSEDMIKLSEEKFRGLYESINDGIIFIDQQGFVLDANRAFVDMIGYTVAELAGMNMRKLTPEIWQPTIESVRKAVAGGGGGSEIEHELIRKDGSRISVISREWLTRDAQGFPLGIWVLIRDVSIQKDAQSELKKRMSEIEKLNRFMIGREMRIIEVKNEVNELLRKSGQQPRYKV